MKKIIYKTEYDTENAELISKKAVGTFGELDGYEETLYQTKDGKYFLYTFGGVMSKYPEENIQRLSPQRAEEWQKNNIEG